MSVDNLAAAIHTAVTDEKQISRAKLAGEAIRKVSLDYCSLITLPPFLILFLDLGGWSWQRH